MLAVPLMTTRSCIKPQTVQKDGLSFRVSKTKSEVPKTCILSFGQPGVTSLVANRVQTD